MVGSALKVESKNQSEALLWSDFSFSCEIHVEVNNLELYGAETDLLYQLRISSNIPSLCRVSPSLSLSLSALVRSLQMAHINKADSHTSVSNLFISPQTEQTHRRSHPDY